jgi:NMD protein affecting ribosome stability and mRNA decay
MAKASHKGEPSRIRRNVQQYGDPYLSKVNPGELAVCTGCHAIYQRRHWHFDEDLYQQSAARPEARQVLCPACRKISDNYAQGEVVLRGAFLQAHREEIMHLISNEEARAKGLNPLERIVRISESAGALTVTTTNEKLAQRVGRALQKAYQGEVSYRWSEDTKFAHVEWAR